MRIKGIAVVLVLTAMANQPVVTAWAQAKKPLTLSELAAYTGADREQRLYEGAKSEGRICRPGAEELVEPSGKAKAAIRSRPTKYGLGTAGRQGTGPRDRSRPPTEPAPARAPGDKKPVRAPQGSLSRHQTPGVKRSSEPTAGESGVSRKAGPISLFGRG